MTQTRRLIGLALLGAGACLLAGPTSRFFGSTAVAAQEQAPNRREFTVTVRDYRFTPDRIEVIQDDLVKVTLESADMAYSFTIDAYRLSRRIPAGGKTTLEFRADQAGTFDFYSNMTGHEKVRGQLIVRRR